MDSFKRFWIAGFFIGLLFPAFAHEGDWRCGYALFPPKLQDGVYPKHYRPDRTVDFQHLHLDIQVFMKEMRIQGKAIYTFQPIHDKVTCVRFDATDMKIESVSSSKQPGFQWTYSDNALYVNFSESLPMNQSCDLAIDYSSNAPTMGSRFDTGMHFSNSKQVDRQSADQMFTIAEPFGASAWFPCGDYPDDPLRTEIAVTVPKELTTLSNGKLIESTENGEWRTDLWRQEMPHCTYLVSLAAGYFDVVRDEWKGIPVEYYVEKGLGKDARPSMGKTPDMIDFFSNYLDYPYPYEKYAQVAVRYFTAGGMEHTTCTTMYEWIVLDENARQDNDMEGLIMHELAHQWFGDLVTCESWPQLWLNESFATFSDALWVEHSRGEDAFEEDMLDKMEGYINSSRSYTRPIVSNRFEDAGEMFDSHSYPKGACVLMMLRHQLGDDLFRKTLHHYLKKNAPGLVDTDDLMESVESITGKPMDRFFEQWIFRPGHPKVTATHQWMPEQKQVKLVLKQTQKMEEGDSAFAFPLEIEIRTDEQTIEKTVHITKMEESVFVDCPTPPRSVNVDPRLRVLMELDHNKTQDMLLTDLEEGSSVIIRIRAARVLADHRNERVREALLNAAKTDPFLRVRLEAVETLSRDRSRATRDALLSLISDPDPKFRGKVVNSLGGFYQEESVIKALVDRFENDLSNTIRANAARILAQVKPDKAYDILKSGFKRESWRNQIQIDTMNALVALEQSQVFNDLVRFSKDPFHRDIRTTAIRNLGRLAANTEKNPDRTLELLLDYLKSGDSAIRRAAIDGLRSLGSEDAIAQLQWVQRNDEVESLQEAAKNAIADIRRDRESDLAGQNAGRIEELENQNKKLEERLNDLEADLKRMSEKTGDDQKPENQ